ncbi:MAG: hypothetical protein PF795_01070, partial [Kiritimatiellae bacterium]|nr:hypothetical protein [Kiritimatiellia bacterium]
MTSDSYLAIIANLDHYSARQRVEAFAKKAHTLHLRLRFFEQTVSVSRIIGDPRCAAVLLCNVDPERGFHAGLRTLKKPVLEASRKIDTPWTQVFLDEQEIARMSYRHFQLLQRNHFAYVGRQQSLSSSEREE